MEYLIAMILEHRATSSCGRRPRPLAFHHQFILKAPAQQLKLSTGVLALQVHLLSLAGLEAEQLVSAMVGPGALDTHSGSGGMVVVQAREVHGVQHDNPAETCNPLASMICGDDACCTMQHCSCSHSLGVAQRYDDLHSHQTHMRLAPHPTPHCHQQPYTF